MIDQPNMYGHLKRICIKQQDFKLHDAKHLFTFIYYIDGAERRTDKPKVVVGDVNISLSAILELLERNFREHKIAELHHQPTEPD